MVSIASVRYITWKYWHAPVFMALSMAIVAAYDMYIECCKGNLDKAWSVLENKRMSFRKFCLTLSKKIIKYNPKLKKYPGYSKM